MIFRPRPRPSPTPLCYWVNKYPFRWRLSSSYFNLLSLSFESNLVHLSLTQGNYIHTCPEIRAYSEQLEIELNTFQLWSSHLLMRRDENVLQNWKEHIGHYWPTHIRPQQKWHSIQFTIPQCVFDAFARVQHLFVYAARKPLIIRLTDDIVFKM